MADKGSNSELLTIGNVRKNIVGIDTQVPLLDGSHRTYVNFDNAASTPALRPVLNKVNEFMSWYSSVHRGTGFKSRLATEVYDEAHEIVCEFFGTDPKTNVTIFGKNSTEALNKLARRLDFGTRNVVLTTLMEHHSNDLPWRAVAQVEHVGIDHEGALDENHLEWLLEKYGEQVRLVALTGASNTTGYINPVHRIAEKTHAVGAEIVVDAAQLAPHRAIDMRPDSDPGHIDYLVISAHKMYAPFGTGALIGKRDIFLRGDPDIVGGGTVKIVTTDEVGWADLPDREEAGSPNVVGAVALAKTILSLQEIGMDELAKHEAALTARLLSRLTRIEGVKIYGINDPARVTEKVGVIPFLLEEMNHSLLAAILSVEGGIGVRNGCFCSHPYLLKLFDLSPEEIKKYQQAILGGDRRTIPGLVRVSFGCYNDETEIDWFIEMMETIADGKYRGRYVQDVATGEFHAHDFSPRVSDYFTLS